eukprot:PhF_6_TR10417/c0_g1_i1/m.16365
MDYLTNLFLPYNAIVTSQDGHPERWQKFVVASLVLSVPYLIACSVTFSIWITTYNSMALCVCNGVLIFSIFFVLGTWCWMWLTKQCLSEKMLFPWIFVLNTIVNIIGICVKESGYDNGFMMVALVAITCQPKYARIHIVYTSMGYYLYRYNMTFHDVTNLGMELRFPGAFSTQEIQIVSTLGAIMWWYFVMLSFALLLRELRSDIARANNTVKMCNDVAEKMLSYDTEGGAQLLEHIANHNNDDGGAVDTRLLSALQTLVANMELFRPHLPEYVWDIVRKRTEQQLYQKLERQYKDEADRGSPLTISGMENATPVTSYPSSTSLLHYLGPETVHNTSVAIIDFRQKTASALSSNNSSVSLHSAEDSNSSVASSIVTIQKYPNPGCVRKLVNWAHTNIVKTRGSLHTFIGDTLRATWCLHVPSPKPAQFLLDGFNKFNVDINCQLSVSGALSTGSSISYMAGDKRQAYILHIPWRERLDMLHRLARTYNSILICEATMEACNNHLVCRWVDTVPLKTGVDGVVASTPLKVIEIVRERTDEEIFFVQRKMASASALPQSSELPFGALARTTDFITNALRECHRGRYSEALRIVRSVTSRREHRSSVSRMLDRLDIKIHKAMDDNVPGEKFGDIDSGL